MSQIVVVVAQVMQRLEVRFALPLNVDLKLAHPIWLYVHRVLEVSHVVLATETWP